jgi:hypothetical protein
VGSHRGFTWDVRGKLTEVTDSPSNTAPTASAGTNATVYVDRLTILNGSGTDAEGEPLTYTWTEGGSNPATGLLRGTTSAQPGFTPTIAGTYAFTLVTSDGRTTSAPSTVTYTVLTGTPPNQNLTSVATAANSGFVNSLSPTRRASSSNTIRTGKAAASERIPWGRAVHTTRDARQVHIVRSEPEAHGHANGSNTAGDSWTVDLLPTTADPNWTSTSWNADRHDHAGRRALAFVTD